LEQSVLNLKVRDVASRLGVSEKTVYKWLRTGLIPATRIGKSWVIPEESVESILQPRAVSRSTPSQSSVSAYDLIQPVQPTVEANELDSLARFTSILNGAVSQGIAGILGPRGSDPKTGAEIADALESATGEIVLQGIGLREFFSERSYTTILRQMASEDRPVQIRALLVNPVSEFARARAVAEDGAQFHDEGRFRGGPLYRDSWRSLNVIAAMKNEAESRRHFGIDVRFVDHWPSAYIVSTNEYTFVETYHFGKPGDALEVGSIDGLVPMLKLRSDSDYSRILRSHFNYIWLGTNPHIPTYNLAEVSDSMQVEV